MTPRLLLLAGLAGAVLGAATAGANEYPWCANFHEGAGTNCGFTSYDQCMQTVRGSGGFCAPNDFYTGSAAKQARRPAAKPASKPASKKD
jgi:uncharacterized protein DUF3551